MCKKLKEGKFSLSINFANVSAYGRCCCCQRATICIYIPPKRVVWHIQKNYSHFLLFALHMRTVRLCDMKKFVWILKLSEWHSSSFLFTSFVHKRFRCIMLTLMLLHRISPFSPSYTLSSFDFISALSETVTHFRMIVTFVLNGRVSFCIVENISRDRIIFIHKI